MIHEQFITLETAKLAKKAGFDWECLARYENEYLILNEQTQGVNWNFISDNICSAPTQAVLQRWLREEKQMQCNSVIDRDMQWDCLCVDCNTAIVFHDTKKHPTYESALEAGLQKCLTLLIEKK